MDLRKINEAGERLIDDNPGDCIAVVIVAIRKEHKPAVGVTQLGDDPYSILKLAKIAIEIAMEHKPNHTEMRII